MEKKAIILAGGFGTRLFPLTKSTNKQLLPVYDKPLIYYPLSTVMKAGIKDILIIVGSDHGLQAISNLLGDGSDFGVNISYIVQNYPRGIAEAFLLGEHFIGNSSVILALGDNIFYGNELDEILLNSKTASHNMIFGCKAANLSSYGVAVLNDDEIIDIEEKPINPKSNWAIPGLYFYDNSVVERTKALVPSKRGELEITDLSMTYIKEPSTDHKMVFKKLFNTFWFDAGTFDDLIESAQFVKAVQKRIGELIGSPKAIAVQKGWIS